MAGVTGHAHRDLRVEERFECITQSAPHLREKQRLGTFIQHCVTHMITQCQKLALLHVVQNMLEL